MCTNGEEESNFDFGVNCTSDEGNRILLKQITCTVMITHEPSSND